MEEKYLVINAGSSSLKFTLYRIPEKSVVVNGYIEKIGKEDSFYTLKYDGKKIKKETNIENHEKAILVMLKELIDNQFINNIDEIKGVGHRVLHGGEFYKESVLIDEEVIKNIKNLTKFGPLHHPGELCGIIAMQEVLPNVPQVATFDTSFHQTMPKENYLYAVPYEWYEKYGVRKYGFHGTSHKYITETMQEKLGKKDVNLIICHIGSGASISCIKDGICINTTMGMTPLAGLIMGTRCGDIDSSIIECMSKELNKSVEEINLILNEKSGFIGLCGKNDMRDLNNLVSTGDELAIITLNMFEKSIVNYIAQYYFELGGKIDSLIFTAGIGENVANVRKDIVDMISKPMNVQIDNETNEKIAGFKDITSGVISTKNSAFSIIVEPTNEEIMILKDTVEIINNIKDKKSEFQKKI